MWLAYTISIHLSTFFWYDQVLFVHSSHGGHSLFAVYKGGHECSLLFIEDKQVSVSAFVQLRVMAGFLVCLFSICTLCLWKHCFVFVFVLEFMCVQLLCIVALSIGLICLCVCVCVSL